MILVLYTLAGLLVVAWLAVTAWAIFHDRPRGRRRCPRCFYEIDAATGRKCSECGHEARTEQALSHTRRRWRMAVAALVVLLGPAIAAAGWARLAQSGGWRGVPTPITTRLLWLNNADHDADVIQRIRDGRLSQADAERVVLAACRRLESDDPAKRAKGFDLLLAFDPNGTRLASDPPNTRRALLENLRPDRTIPILIRLSRSEDAPEATKAIRTMTSLRDISDDVLLAIVDGMGAAPTDVRQAARIAAMQHIGPGVGTRRYVPAPFNLFMGGDAKVDPVAFRFTRSVRELAHDRPALLYWLRASAMDSDPVNDPKFVHRRLALWLYSRLSRYNPAALDVVEAALDVPDEFLGAIAAHQLKGFEWSPRVEQAIRSALRDRSVRVHSEAVRSAAAFKHDAASLIPEFVDYAGSLDRQGGSSAFVEFYRSIGGNTRDLLPSVHARLEAIAEQADEAGVGTDGRWVREPQIFSIDWLWISTMDVVDPERANLAVKYARRSSRIEVVLEAIVAFAVLSGDQEAATSLIIERNPSLAAAVNPQFPNPPLLRLVRLDLVNVARLLEHYAGSSDPIERAAAATLLDRFILPEQINTFPSTLNRLATDSDPLIASAAQRAIARATK